MRVLVPGLILVLAFRCSSGRELDWTASSAELSTLQTEIELAAGADLWKHHHHHHKEECDKGQWRKKALKLIDEAPAAGSVRLL